MAGSRLRRALLAGASLEASRPGLLCIASDASRPARLRVVNGCQSAPIWIAHSAEGDDSDNPQNIRLEPSQSLEFVTPGGSGARYWPKMWCNEAGEVCGLGESGGLEEACVADVGCAPPVDTKFEATFGHTGGEDLVDVSLVDGFTLPFKLELKGSGCSIGRGDEPSSVLDCSGLRLEDCPVFEDLGDFGERVNLTVVHPSTKGQVGCHSPCSRLTARQWRAQGDVAQSLQSGEAAPFCCPLASTSEEDCRAGPAGTSNYVRVVHGACPGVHAFSYDEGPGFIKCPSDTHYEVTFYCPHSESEGDRAETVAAHPDSAKTEERGDVDDASASGDDDGAKEARGDTAEPEDPSSVVVEGPIRSAQHRSRCLEAGEAQQEGSRERSLQLLPCSLAAQQRFRVDRIAGTIRWAEQPDLCVDISRGPRLVLCEDDAISAQRFLLPPGLARGKIRLGDECLGASGDGAAVVLADCAGGGPSSQDFLFGSAAVGAQDPPDAKAFGTGAPASASSSEAPLRFLERPPENIEQLSPAGSGSARRLTIANGCRSETMWIAHSTAAHEMLTEDSDPPNVPIRAGESFDFVTPDGASGLRFWPKLRCGEGGDMCELGDSPGPDNSCGDEVVDCSPPMDTKFDVFYFGRSGEDRVSVNLVDGFTLPFKLELEGGCRIDEAGWESSQTVVDCAGLSLGLCPASEQLGPSVGVQSMKAFHPVTNQLVGCFSPCAFLTQNMVTPQNVSSPFCCSEGSAEQCRAGPASSSAYVAAVHQMCPGLRAFAYDGRLGMLRCPSDTRYRLTFYCPKEFEPREAQPQLLASEDAAGPSAALRRRGGADSAQGWQMSVQSLAGVAAVLAVGALLSAALAGRRAPLRWPPHGDARQAAMCEGPRRPQIYEALQHPG